MNHSDLKNKYIYLNNAAEGWAKPHRVIREVLSVLEGIPSDEGRTLYCSTNILQLCRETVKRFINAEEKNCIVFTSNATDAINKALWGLIPSVANIVITTEAEHNSVLRPLYYASKKYNTRIYHIPFVNGLFDEEYFVNVLSCSDRAIFAATHASNVTGNVLDVERLFKIAHQYGAITILDASQTAGRIPLDVKKLGCDILIFPAHKAMRGVCGAAVLYVSPKLFLEQTIVGGTGYRSDLVEHPSDMPTRLEAGTHNLPAIAGLKAAIEFIEEHTDYWTYQEELTDLLLKELVTIDGIELFEFRTKHRIGIVSFRIKGWMVKEAEDALVNSFGIVCRTGLHCAPLIHKALNTFPEGTIRFSLSASSSFDDVQKAIEAVKKMALWKS